MTEKLDTHQRDKDILQQFHDDYGEYDDTSFELDNIRRRFTREHEDDLFDIEQIEEQDNTLTGSTASGEEKQEEDGKQQLSTRLSQLMTFYEKLEENDHRTTTIPIASSLLLKTQMKTYKEMPTSHRIPKYLAKENKEFNEMILNLRKQTNTSITTEELRDIAYLIYQIECIELDKRLSMICLRSGQGTLAENKQSSLLIWPNELKLKMIAEGYTKAKSPNEIFSVECVQYVEKCLEKYQSQILDFKKQIEEKKQQIGHRWTSKIHETLTKFVQQYDIALYRIFIEAQIIRIEYDYIDRLCQFEFCNEHSNLYQKQLFEYVSQKKFDKEKSKLELSLLKQRISLNYLPKSFDGLEIVLPNSLTTIMDNNTQQHLKDRSGKILQRTKSDLMMIYIGAVEVRANQCQIDFDNAMAKLRENERIGLAYRQFTKTMSDIMMKRFNNISEHLISAYKLKLRTFTKPWTNKN